MWLENIVIFVLKGPSLDFNFNQRKFHDLDPNLVLLKFMTSNFDIKKLDLELGPYST